MIGFYNGDSNCDAYISAHNNPHGNFSAPACNGVDDLEGQHENLYAGDPPYVYNNDSRVGTNDEPIEHIACELSWYLYYNWSEWGTNVKILAHSMGGLIVRYMIERVQAGDTHFAYFLDISDVVTFSTPHAGADPEQTDVESVLCQCIEALEMQYYVDGFHDNSSAFTTDIHNHNHPNAAYGTDWTMIGSLGTDPLDWDYQATFMSNSGGLSNNHRIGYNYPIKCNGTTEYANGYDHGDYMNDGCDAYDAPYYYCDGCSKDQHSWFSYTTAAPHSLHEMLFAFVYTNW